jgi:tetratricopeptide (TPR) repeat protein
MLEESLAAVADRDVLMRKATILRQVAEAAASEAAQSAVRPEVQYQKRLKAERAWKESGELNVQIAETFDARSQKEYPDDMWAATRCYLEAGDSKSAIKYLQLFIKQQPRDGRSAQARLDLGRQYEAMNQWDDAVKTLQTLADENGTTLAGYEGMYRLGEAFIHRGPDFHEQAEKAFLRLLDETPTVAPESIWYQKTLLEFGRLLYRRGKYDQALLRLNEYLRRYPQDPETRSASYLVAACVRQQGLAALEKSVAAVRLSDKEAYREIHRQKLESAVGEFRRLMQEYELLPQAEQTPLRREEYQNVLFGLADSLYELGNYEEAIKVYNVIVHRFQTSPCAMSAYVQLAAAYETIGRADQATAVFERARWTLEKIPENAFGRNLGEPTKQYWANWIKSIQH